MTYIGTDKKGHNQNERVRAKHVIMACWNRVSARLVDGLPDDQVANLCYARKVPLIYGRVGAEELAGLGRRAREQHQSARTSLFWDSTSVSAGAGFGPTGSPVYGPTPNQPPASPAQSRSRSCRTSRTRSRSSTPTRAGARCCSSGASPTWRARCGM